MCWLSVCRTRISGAEARVETGERVRLWARTVAADIDQRCNENRRVLSRTHPTIIVTIVIIIFVSTTFHLHKRSSETCGDPWQGVLRLH
jgi:hypothetical protein